MNNATTISATGATGTDVIDVKVDTAITNPLVTIKTSHAGTGATNINTTAAVKGGILTAIDASNTGGGAITIDGKNLGSVLGTVVTVSGPGGANVGFAVKF